MNSLSPEQEPCGVPDGLSANRKLDGSPIKEKSNFRVVRQPSRTPKSAVIAECIGDYASNEADWFAYPIHPMRPHEWGTSAHGLNGG